ncbi:hypothetical protein K439DRAFT_338001 [Ramaria rubella]|nr:hypothetical protein K439DRAFT_338001 [Ramaria rubella]
MSTTDDRPRSLRFSRAQLEQHLQILKAAVAAPLLPPTLPPSPPASRSTSPIPPPSTSSAKRKLPQDASSDTSKRSRVSLQHSDIHHQDMHSRAAPPQPRKDEEALLPLPSTSSALPTLATAPTPGGPEPASFPHRRGKPSAADFTRFHERYSLHGKYLKYSAELRTQAASFGQDHQVQRKLNSAPPAGSPYAVQAQLFARIEAVDALLNFTYAMWCKDMVENKCHHVLWDTIDEFLKWVRTRWETAETRGDAQCAFIGIIRMVEAYIYARKAAFLNTANAKRFGEVDKAKPPPFADPSSSISPATSLGGSSQHSVPNASPPTGSCASPIPNPAPSRPPTNTSHPPPSTAATPHPALGPTVAVPKDLYDSLRASHNCSTRSARAMAAAALYINLPILSRCFPRTAARVQAAQLRIDEEFEVDFDQDECSREDGVPGVGFGGDPSPGPGEGQLLWPGALNSHGGEGVAWVCLLGRAMIREIGYPLGYRGLDGILRKEATAR